MADTIDFGKVKQGSQPTLTFVWPLPTSPAHTPDDLDGFTITGVMQNIDTGDVTAISSGAVTVTTGATRTCAWEMGATDTGTAGSFLVVLTATDGSTPIKTLNGSLYIESDPSVTAIAGESLEGVPTSDAAWLATSASGGALGTAAYAATGDFDAAGDAAAAQAAAIAALGGADSIVTDEQLRNWAGQLPELMTAVTRTDYSASYVDKYGQTQYAGWVQVTGTVTWPDGQTGHLDGVEYPEQPGVLQYFTASHVGSGKIVVQSPLVDGVAGLTVITPDYYVDSSAAADGDGSLATPYDALSDLSGLQSGDVVAIKSGSTFRETFTVEAGVSVYRYGAGAKPIVDCADVINGTWTQDDTYTNLWKITVTPDEAGVTDIDTNLWIDGTYPSDARAATLSAANSTDEAFYVDNDTAATQTIYYNPTTSNPNEDGRVYEFNSRLAAIQGDPSWPDNVVLDGIVCKRQRSGSGGAILGRGAVTRHCEFIDGTKHNLYVGDGWTAYGCLLLGAMWSGASATLSVYNEATPASLGINIYDCVFDSERTTYSIYTGGHGHNNKSGDFGAVLYQRCYFRRLAAGVTAGNGGFDGITLARCVQYQCRDFQSFSTLNTGDIIIEFNIVKGGSARFAGSRLAQTYYIRNNYVLASGQSGCVRAGAGTLYLYGNEFKSDDSAGVPLSSRIAVRYDNSTGTIRQYDNVFYGTADGSGAAAWGYFLYSLANPTPRIYSDRNHYGNSTRYCYFPEDSFNGDVAVYVGTALNGLSNLGGADGDASQDGRSDVFA